MDESIQDEAEKYNDQPDMIISVLIVCVMPWGHINEEKLHANITISPMEKIIW